MIAQFFKVLFRDISPQESEKRGELKRHNLEHKKRKVFAGRLLRKVKKHYNTSKEDFIVNIGVTYYSYKPLREVITNTCVGYNVDVIKIVEKWQALNRVAITGYDDNYQYVDVIKIQPS